ncbi:hypothetical protein FDF12_11290 [Clostridium botulinum]|uniref:hypothetical protein n=1 Tax=Clostridium sp. CH2 TaxID=2949990 RepID=UPI0013F09409|nr:hypothetical protein [Clostridium sp. CH2]NFS29195.1 hypothetical protein [Clostridium botulinum]NFS53743.1 hypothetical protein [Clostridium botulinum]NFT17940.1 hypothetical protein [Clostridium botulinum]
MQKKLKGIDILIICIIILLTAITIVGLYSFRTDESYIITNQYGDSVKIFGNGIYAHDSYFKAPIFIGSDCTMLFLVVPMTIVALIGEIKRRTIKSKLLLTTVTATVLYYSTSIAFGVTYNALHLVYIALFSSSLFAFIILVKSIREDELRKIQKWILPSNGLSVFLVLSGISLFVAWLPDIITSLINGKSLSLIEVYTTEITYVIDMGVISPLIFICLFLLKKKEGLGYILLAIILKICKIIEIMIPIQTLFQTMAGIEIPVPVLITKVGIFVVLAIFAAYFNIKFYKKIRV